MILIFSNQGVDLWNPFNNSSGKFNGNILLNV